MSERPHHERSPLVLASVGCTHPTEETVTKAESRMSTFEYLADVQSSVLVLWPMLLGNVLEWYEFGVFAFVEDEITANFFTSAAQTWTLFALSFVLRPVNTQPDVAGGARCLPARHALACRAGTGGTCSAFWLTGNRVEDSVRKPICGWLLGPCSSGEGRHAWLCRLGGCCLACWGTKSGASGPRCTPCAV
jgi:hypothetical protein